MTQSFFSNVQDNLQRSPLDILGQENIQEKLVHLMMEGVSPSLKTETARELSRLYDELASIDVKDAKVVIFGGGSGLANIVGGSSRLPVWQQDSFTGLKEIFPRTKSVVCVTDDGGSTGELLKDLPLIALGDIRHVLLSSVQLKELQALYQLSTVESQSLTAGLSRVFNYRLALSVHSDELMEELNFAQFPPVLGGYLRGLYQHLLTDDRLAAVRKRFHCLGNLLLVAAIYRRLDVEMDLFFLENSKHIHGAIKDALEEVGQMIGVGSGAVLPCTSTPSQLHALYTNGVEISGEFKMSTSNRGYPVDSVAVDFSGSPMVYEEVLANIADADLLLFAPGSLYTSIIPVLKVAKIAEAVRANTHALKLLVSNLWVQTGETDRSISDPSRKFRVSDMLRAYEDNIQGGAKGLFEEILCLSLDDVPASVLQDYAVEGKVPIYLDREVVKEMGYEPVECGVYSRVALQRQGFIQHDPRMLAEAVRVLYTTRHLFDLPIREGFRQKYCAIVDTSCSTSLLPAQRYRCLQQRIEQIVVEQFSTSAVRDYLYSILWQHPDIPLAHLDYFSGICAIAPEDWRRNQKWDNVFSFYDPKDRFIKIRSDQLESKKAFELAFLIALGEALLGNYALTKEMEDLFIGDDLLGQVYHLRLRPVAERVCFFSDRELQRWLLLARMNYSEGDSKLNYARLTNAGEMFTPPGLLLGLMYAWYIDNRLASHIEYKMSIMKITSTNLIPAQKKMLEKRRWMIDFLREVVFCKKRNDDD
ncbi:gluconeogenesis factor YvcK family protein [Desulfotalea psychrophila]|uniref:Gluconeogenesis factor n=1 Tax=Desulfotalea psychrophila (strain LSv54 / DSM 12343) TaxID=177439 RepID=Q6AL33_DESPS|nr:gluconeogenesis factor YvcK family protein [Desulfotalea psychrophila]CAG36942.1 hypothetical protein DP2213 [Desulfotalea psychrophila LSv54]